MTVSTETVRMAKSRPGKNQSERSDLPCHIIKRNTPGCYIPLFLKLVTIVLISHIHENTFFFRHKHYFELKAPSNEI